MATKHRVTKRRISNPFTAQVNSIQSCIDQDLDKITKCYPKLLIDVDKAIKTVTFALKKTKSKPAGRGKTKAGKMLPGKLKSTASIASASTALEKQLRSLRSEKLGIQASYKKLLGQKKVLKQFENTCTKQLRSINNSARASNSSKFRGIRPVASSAFLGRQHHNVWSSLQ